MSLLFLLPPSRFPLPAPAAAPPLGEKGFGATAVAGAGINGGSDVARFAGKCCGGAAGRAFDADVSSLL